MGERGAAGERRCEALARGMDRFEGVDGGDDPGCDDVGGGME